MTPEFSVIVPAYNVAPYVGTTISSVLAQQDVELELIVVNDGSYDETASVCRLFRDRRIRVVDQVNSGVSAARNRGLSLATGEKVVFLDGDDILEAQALRRLGIALDQHPSSVLAYGVRSLIDDQGNPFADDTAPVFTPRPSGNVTAILLCGNIIQTGAQCVRLTALRAAQGFDESLSVFEDWEFWTRLSLFGDFQFIGGPPVLRYRRRLGSAINNPGLDEARYFAAIEKVFTNPDICARFTPRQLRRYRRIREGGAFDVLGETMLRLHHPRRAREYFWRSALHSGVTLRRTVLLIFAALGWVPAFAAARIGMHAPRSRDESTSAR
jgi:glycosyltransferase involved in cell wall biosynthesis